jgi:catechol 2,3-dioxygenase-like lactoylglutathione lyase family enzyme
MAIDDHNVCEFPGREIVPQIRVARPTDQLQAVVAFYRDGLGFPVIGQFSGHGGYDGVMLGVPGRPFHLEFTQHAHGSPCPAPTTDNLLVLYVPDSASFESFRDRLTRYGAIPVRPENPYWEDKSLTYEDPDGWRVVLCRVTGV